MYELDRQEALNMLLGASILGTGGGGSLEKGISIMSDAYNQGFTVKMLDPDEVLDSSFVCSVYECGSIGKLDNNEKIEFEKMRKVYCSPTLVAIEVLENCLQQKVEGILPIELGGENLAVAMEAAALLEKPLIDADPAGRCVPGMQHTTYYLKDIPSYPMGLANKLGDELVLQKAADDYRIEEVVRALSTASFNVIGVADHAQKWKELNEAIIPRTLSMCLKVGNMVEECKKSGVSWIERVAELCNGYVLMEGEVTKANYEDKGGYTYGEIEIKGSAQFLNDTFKIWAQNENIISWKNDQVYITVPDSVNLVDLDTQMPLLNPDAVIGQNIGVFAVPSFDAWRTKKGIECFGPKSFGFDIEYVTLETIMNT